MKTQIIHCDCCQDEIDADGISCGSIKFDFIKPLDSYTQQERKFFDVCPTCIKWFMKRFGYSLSESSGCFEKEGGTS